MRLGELSRQAAYIEAKAKHLKAIDFTIGLLRRMQKQGIQLQIDYNVALGRLKEIRKLSQSKFRLDTLMDNIEKLKGSEGSDILRKIEKIEAPLLPEQRDLVAFQQEFPSNVTSATLAQEKIYLAVIAPVLQVPPAEVDDIVIKDAVAFREAYDAVLPMLQKLKAVADSTVGKGAGTYVSRIKTPESAFPKQVRDDRVPFFRFRDLVGCRILTKDVRDLATTTHQSQRKFAIVDKKNYYLKSQGYNAINFVLAHTGQMFEFQLKTSINDVEANISHDLIYAKEKAVVNLSKEEKVLVSKTIDASTQLSMREWQQLLGLPMVTSTSRR